MLIFSFYFGYFEEVYLVIVYYLSEKLNYLD